MIQVSHLTKSYGTHKAIQDLCFSIEKGRIYGFLGPNGAGKSTTMNIITGCLAATAGTVTIGGYDLFEEPLKAKALIGYLPEQPPLYTDMTPREYLAFVLRARSGSFSEAALQSAMEKARITHVQNRIIKTLSKGYRQRVGIAQALLGNPEIIILDEPTVGLDPKQMIEIRDLIRELGKTHTVILSSHILSEVREVCDEIMILSHGHLVACDTAENLTKRFSGNLQLQIAVKAPAKEFESALKVLENLQCSGVTQQEGLSQATLTLSDKSASEAVFFLCAENRWPIYEMTPVQTGLEEIFLKLTQEDTLAEASEKPKENNENAAAEQDFPSAENASEVKE